MGQIIKYTDKAFLREEPFGNPIDNPTPVQKHSFIFPGDEIVLYHKLSLPDDANVSTMNEIKFVSAKVSIIAQKPNIFTEEFSREFQATRNFVLDSFEVSFTGINARIIPWGTDGYAPNLTVQQDRDFKLPLGDFRRQINFFTKHVDSTNIWAYWFYFPILFRWEYWIALLNADNDFYNASQPQDGLNNWWYHYFNDSALPFGWIIKSRLELNTVVDGVQTIIRSELNLTPAVGDVNDYESNTDYDDREIKTSKVGGTLSNTPAFVYGTENTVILADLTKQTPFGVGEQDNVSCIIWIEPFEGPGSPSRTRGSSVYPITPESVFKGLNISATDSNGIGITNAAGQFVVYDSVGNGSMVLFDSGTPEFVRMIAVINNEKLIYTYPGITKFTIYARLYNSTLDPDATKKGEEFKQDLTLVITQPINIICSQKAPLCPYDLHVYADTTDADEMKNDKSDFYYFGDATISSMVMTLQKNVDSCGDGAWEDKTEIDKALGDFFDFGKNPDFSGDAFMDDYNKKYTGAFIEWRKVLDAYGTGKYRIQITQTDVFDIETIFYDQREFCLHTYNCDVANKTVRIETFNEGLRGAFGLTELTDYADGWRGQIRLKGLLKYIKSGYVNEFVQYGEVNNNIRKPYINEQQPAFTLSLKPIPGWMQIYISTNVLQADEITITDFNTSNPMPLIKVPVINAGEFTPKDNSFANPLQSVDISLQYANNNLRKRNSQ